MDTIGDYIARAYVGLVMAFYVESSVSLCLTHLVEERTLNISIVLGASYAVLSMCLFGIVTQYFRICVHVWYSVVDLQIESRVIFCKTSEECTIHFV